MTMKTRIARQPAARKERAMTLMELMVAMAIGSIVLVVVAVLVIFAARSFAALTNYQALDEASSFTADNMSKEVREATKVVSFQSQGNSRWIVFANTNASPAYTFRYDWTAASRELTRQRSFEASPTVLLKGCDRWDFTFQQRTPLAGPGYGFSTNMINQDECKLVTMTWKCSRSINSTKLLNTETVQTAQIVLRNQKTP